MRLPLLSLCLALALAAGSVHAQRPPVAGLVVDDSTGTPIRGAQVTLTPGRNRVSSDSAGRFLLAGVAPGDYAIQVSALGYAAVVGTLTVTAEGAAVQVRLAPAPIALGEVAVEVAQTTIGWSSTGFERRRAGHSGSGRFLDRAQLAARGNSNLPTIFRGMPGVTIVSSPDGSLYAASASQQAPNALGSGAGKPCYAQVFVDGIFQSAGVDLRGYPPESLESVEYYRHPSSTPVEFRTGGSQCGTVLLWTRRT
jgi:hypothetical protein